LKPLPLWPTTSFERSRGNPGKGTNDEHSKWIAQGAEETIRMTNTTTISNRIFTRLSELHLTQHEFSKRTGILPSTISEWKNGTNPSSDKIMSICRALNVSPEWLLEGSTPVYGGKGDGHSGSRGEHESDYYTIHKSSNMGRLITMYLKIKPALQGRVIGYVEGLSEADEDWSPVAPQGLRTQRQ